MDGGGATGPVLDLAGTVALLRDAGLIGALIAVLWGGMRRWWVWGWAYQEMRDQRDEWRREAEAMRNVGRQTATTAVQSTSVAEQAAQIAADIIQRRTAPPATGGTG